MNIFTVKRQNLEIVLTALLRSLKVQINTSTSDACVQKHPNYPSILSLSDCLDSWKVKNDAYKIDKKDYGCDDLLFPFTAHFPEHGGRFILVHSIEEGIVRYSDEYKKDAVMNEDIFLQRWSGVALHAEKTGQSGEVCYKGQYLFNILQKMLYPITLVLSLSIIILTIIFHPFSGAFVSASFIKCIGSAISLLLLYQSANPKNSFIHDLCSLGGKGDCNGVLRSKEAQLAPWLSWSEIGFYYFTGSLLLLLIYPSSIGLLAWLNVLALPYTFWSLSYQFRNKKWCIFCCAVLIVLWAEFLVNIGFDSFSFKFETALLYMAPLSFLTPIVAWSLLKRSFKHVIQPFKEQLSKFKYNTELFQQVLTVQPRYAVGDELFPILLGNPTASTVITMVSNPYCDPCAKAHAILEDWLKAKKDILIKVLFYTPDWDDDFRTKAARHLSSLTLSDDKELAGLALAHWYTKKDTYENWSAQYPIADNDENHNTTKIQKEWCEKAEITFTPTILINGYKLPEPYVLDDIKYLLS